MTMTKTSNTTRQMVRPRRVLPSWNSALCVAGCVVVARSNCQALPGDHVVQTTTPPKYGLTRWQQHGCFSLLRLHTDSLLTAQQRCSGWKQHSGSFDRGHRLSGGNLDGTEYPPNEFVGCSPPLILTRFHQIPSTKLRGE